MRKYTNNKGYRIVLESMAIAVLSIYFSIMFVIRILCLDGLAKGSFKATLIVISVAFIVFICLFYMMVIKRNYYIVTHQERLVIANAVSSMFSKSFPYSDIKSITLQDGLNSECSILVEKNDNRTVFFKLEMVNKDQIWLIVDDLKSKGVQVN